MKAKFDEDDIGRVTLSYDFEDYDGGIRRAERIFTCPADGGYVREYLNGDWTQVCDHLCHMGSTLYCSSRDNLLAMIRREYQAKRRAEKRWGTL